MKLDELALESQKLWSYILKKDDISKQEDFFDQGGTSLSLIQLISETKKRFSVQLKASDFEEGLSLEIYETLLLKSMNKEPQKVI